MATSGYPDIVQVENGTGSASSTSPLSVSLSQAIAQGDSAILVIGIVGGSDTVSTVTGGGFTWTLAGRESVTEDCEIWYGTNNSGVSSAIVITPSQSTSRTVDWALVEVNALITTSPKDQFNETSGSSTSTTLMSTAIDVNNAAIEFAVCGWTTATARTFTAAAGTYFPAGTLFSNTGSTNLVAIYLPIAIPYNSLNDVNNYLNMAMTPSNSTGVWVNVIATFIVQVPVFPDLVRRGQGWGPTPRRRQVALPRADSGPVRHPQRRAPAVPCARPPARLALPRADSGPIRLIPRHPPPAPLGRRPRTNAIVTVTVAPITQAVAGAFRRQIPVLQNAKRRLVTFAQAVTIPTPVPASPRRRPPPAPSARAKSRAIAQTLPVPVRAAFWRPPKPSPVRQRPAHAAPQVVQPVRAARRQSTTAIPGRRRIFRGWFQGATPVVSHPVYATLTRRASFVVWVRRRLGLLPPPPVTPPEPHAPCTPGQSVELWRFGRSVSRGVN